MLERERELAVGRPEILVLRVDRADPAKNAVRGLPGVRAACSSAEPDAPRPRRRCSRCSTRRGSRFPSTVDCRSRDRGRGARVNERFAPRGWQPARLDVRDDFPLSVAAYASTTSCSSIPVTDGLNLVAKEAPLVTRATASLVLSREAGAFEELGDWAVAVDPLDVEEQADALEQAIGLPAAERRRGSRRIVPGPGTRPRRLGDARARRARDARPRAASRRRSRRRRISSTTRKTRAGRAASPLRERSASLVGLPSRRRRTPRTSLGAPKAPGYDAHVSVGPDVVAQELVSGSNPATLEAVGRVPLTPPEELAEAMGEARMAQAAFAREPLAERAGC